MRLLLVRLYVSVALVAFSAGLVLAAFKRLSIAGFQILVLLGLCGVASAISLVVRQVKNQ